MNHSVDENATPSPDAGQKRTRRSGKASLTRIIGIVVLLAVIVSVAIFGIRWIGFSRSHVRTDDAQVDADIYSISSRVSGHVLRVLVSTNQRVHAGQLLAEIDPTDLQVAVRQAEAALAQAQSAVTAAQGTVSYTERTGAAGVSQAEAQVGAAQANERMSERQSGSAAEQIAAAQAEEAASDASVDAAKHAVAVAEAGLTSASARADEAKKDAERVAQLLKSGAVSAQQHDASVAASLSAQAALDAAQAQVQSAQSALAQTEARRRESAISVRQARERAAAARAQIEQAQAATGQAQAALKSALSSPVQTRVRKSEAAGAAARVADAQARLAQALLNLSYTRIVSPVDGVAAAKNVEPGQYVQPGQSLIAIVADATVYVTANLKETQMQRVRPGERATFRVDAYPGVSFTGRVDSISPGTGAVFSLLPPENASGNFTKVVQRIPVRIAIDHADGSRFVLRAGMSAAVTIDTGTS